MPQDRGNRLKQALDMRGRFKFHAFAVEVGVNPSSVTRWLQGGFISTEHAVSVCEILSVSLDWLLLGKGDIEPPDAPVYSSSEQKIILACRRMPDGVVQKVEQLLTTMAELTR